MIRTLIFKSVSLLSRLVAIITSPFYIQQGVGSEGGGDFAKLS